MPTESIDHVSIAAVEERVKCEIGVAYSKLKTVKGTPDLSKWAAGLTLTLAVDNTGGVTPSSSLVGPYGRISPLELSATISGNAKRTALLNVFMSFAEAELHVCPPASPIPIEGHLGLSEWIVRVFEAQLGVDRMSQRDGARYRGFDFNSKDKSLGYTLEFLLTLNASATPNFLISNGSAKSVFSLESKSTHSVDIAMLEMDDAEFQKHFRTVTIPGKIVKQKKSDPNNKDLMTMQDVYVPPRTERQLIGTTITPGPNTKIRLETVLQQLNNKALLQTLRR